MILFILFIQIILGAAVPTGMIFYGIWRRQNLPDIEKKAPLFAEARAKLSKEALEYQYIFFSRMMIITGINIGICGEIYLITSTIVLKSAFWITSISIMVVDIICIGINIFLSRYALKKQFDEEGNPIKSPDEDEELEE